MSESTDVSEPQGENEPLGEPGIKALHAEREARKAAEKKVADAQAKLDEIEQANLSDLERARKEAADAKAERDALARENLVAKVALAKGIPSDLAGFLSGDTEEEVAAKADTLLTHLKNPTNPTPAPDPTQGAKGDPAPTSNANAFAQIIEGQLS